MVKAELLIDTQELEQKITKNVLKSIGDILVKGLVEVTKDPINEPNNPPSKTIDEPKHEDKITGKDIRDLLDIRKTRKSRDVKFNKMLEYARAHTDRLPLRIRNTISYLVEHPRDKYNLVELGEKIVISDGNERINREYIKEHLIALGYKYEEASKCWLNEKWS